MVYPLFFSDGFLYKILPYFPWVFSGILYSLYHSGFSVFTAPTHFKRKKEKKTHAKGARTDNSQEFHNIHKYSDRMQHSSKVFITFLHNFQFNTQQSITPPSVLIAGVHAQVSCNVGFLKNITCIWNFQNSF